jgi:diketogulonate reductase-like aldo/keto reductase
MQKELGVDGRGLSRRELLQLAAGAVVLGGAARSALLRRPIPTTGELLPVVGLGTWQTFDAGASESERAPLREVLRTLVEHGGKVVDSSPMYGRSEKVVGDLASDLQIREALFLATKVWTRGREAGIRQMEESFRLLRAKRVDLMQVHNLLDWRDHLATLRRWKEGGKIRYVGVTHYTASAYGELARVMASEPLDFVQVNYSAAEREAEKRILPLAVERRIAVLINRPFAEGALFRNTAGKPLPPWAADIGCASWAQLFLKFVISHPAVTCAIPGTSKPRHLADNLGAALLPLPDEKTRERLARHIMGL